MKIKLCEVFEGIQGEGRYVGKPMLFVRFSGCTRACPWCDTQYHIEGKEVEINFVEDKIKEYRGGFVCFTGGEPLFQKEVCREIIRDFKCLKEFHLETNGDLLESKDFDFFDYIVVSPKDVEVAKRACKFRYDNFNLDIKVVTDLKTVGLDLLKYATMVMPLTTTNEEKNRKIAQDVWRYCVKNNQNFCSRIHYYIWGKKRKV